MLFYLHLSQKTKLDAKIIYWIDQDTFTHYFFDTISWTLLYAQF